MALKLARGRLAPVKTFPVVLEGVHVPPDNPKPVTLHLRYAGRANEGYFNALVASAEPKPSGNAAADGIAADLRIAKIYADHVIDHWDDVTDGESPVKYTSDLGLELLTWIIAEEKRPEKFRVVVYEAVNPANFELGGVDPAAVGKS